MKKELIDFLNWFRTEVSETTPIDSDYFVDKYLSSTERPNVNKTEQAKDVCKHSWIYGLLKLNGKTYKTCLKCMSQEQI